MKSAADAHIHLFKSGFFPTDRGAEHSELREYEQFRSLFNIAKALVIGYEGERRFRGNNDYILELATQHDWIVPLRYVTAQRFTGKWDVQPLYAGLSMYPSDEDISLLLDLPDSDIRRVEARSPLISINVSSLGLLRLVPFVARMPETTFLVSHLGLPAPTPYEEGLEQARRRLNSVLTMLRLPNTVVKVSGLYATQVPSGPHPFLPARTLMKVLRNEISLHQIVWGSDFSPATAHASMPEIFALEDYEVFTSGELDFVRGDNLRQLLRAVSARASF